MTRSRPLLAALTAAALLTAGCTSAHDPQPNYSSVSTTPTSASPTPTTSPSPTGVPATGPNVGSAEKPPVAAAEISDHDKAGALAFAAYYYRLSDWAFATSDFDILDPLFAAACTKCTSAQQNLKGLVSGGKYFTGGRITTNSVAVVNVAARAGSEIAIAGTFAVAAAELRDKSGNVVRTEPADPSFALTDWLAWSGNGWQIVDEEKS